MTGQALIWGLAFAGVAATALVAVYNFGQIALARTRLTHAADAAAYSGAVMQARSLNMLAHVQRTQIAHQVAIAHLVTLGSWAKFSDTQSRQHGGGNPPGFVIGKFFGWRHRTAYAASRGMPDDLRGALHNALDGHQRISHEVLDAVAKQLVRGLAATRDAAIRQVLQANLPGLTVSPLAGDVVFRIEDDTWPRLLQAFARGGGKPGAPMRQAVLRAVSAYGFVGRRNKSAYGLWPTQPYCPWLRHTLRRRGDTRMDARGLWIATDTQSFHSLRGNRYIGCYFREYAMGWAMVRPSNQPMAYDPPQGVPDTFPDEHFWRWARRVARWNLLIPDNRVGVFRGARDAWPVRQRGLPGGFDVASGRMDASFTLRLRQAGESLSTTDGRSVVRLISGSFFQPVLAGAGGVHADAAAQTYFEVAPGQRGGASAWRPYWHARLIAAQQSRRRRLARMRGQALAEACLTMALLAILLMAVLSVGDTLARTQRDDHDSRLVAFTAVSANPSVVRAMPLAREPGGADEAAAEMRRAWRYADRGALLARVGTRTSAVLREVGARSDNDAVQRALGRSYAAWREASEPSLRLGRRINTMAHGIDRAWGREPVAFDWLARWSHVDVRRRRPGVRRGSAPECPWDMLSETAGEAGNQRHDARRRALWRARQLAVRLDALHHLDDGEVRAARPALWAGIPLAYRVFVQRGTPAALVRRARQYLPELRDLMVDETGIALTGRDGDDRQVHWLMRWTVGSGPDGAEATLSLLDLGSPPLNSQPPGWLGPGTRTWRHEVRAEQASVLWCATENAGKLSARAHAELRSLGFLADSPAGPVSGRGDAIASWHRPGCRAWVLPLTVEQTPCGGRDALWLSLQGEAS